MSDNSVRDDYIRQWMSAKDNAEKWAARETDLRLYLCRQLFGYDHVAGNVVGTKHIDLGNNYSFDVTFTQRYKLIDNEYLRAAIERARNLADPLPKPLVKWTPDLSLTAYKACDDKIKQLVDKALTVIPNMPQVAVKGPK